MAEVPVPRYYQGLGVADKFKNLDLEDNLHFFEKCISQANTSNLCVDFGKGEAWCAVDINPESWNSLLQSPRPSSFDIRYIVVWGPHDQHDLVKALTNTYGFTPRLSAVLNSPLKKFRDVSSRASETNRRQDPPSPLHRRHHPRYGHGMADLEKRGAQSIPVHISKPDPLRTLNYYDVVNRIWHWSTFDLDAKYLCLGQNNLHHIDHPEAFGSQPNDNPDLPKGHRVWSWNILCNDKTVVTLVEHPIARTNDDGSPNHFDVTPIRGNMLNVFKQLSRAYKPQNPNPISICPVRFGMSLDNEETDKAFEDPPGMLLYHLYDDWRSTYALIAREQHQYGAELNRLRDDMLLQASLEHVDRLHTIGRQLSALKRLYLSYIVVIERTLGNKQSATAAVSRPSASQHPSNRLISTPFQFGQGYDHLEVYLSSAARVRFERLRDRIELYALTEIQECLEVKDSLLAMNYNLVLLKESNSVERLTRITILLAKATVLFLPVSLMTAYFSTQLKDHPFTITEYWVSFAVILTVSLLALVIFSTISGTVEGQMVYQPFYKAALRFVRSPFWRREEGRPEEDKLE